MHNLDLILTLTGGLGAALILGYITHRLGLSPIVGYLLAGTLVGPHTPGFVADVSLAEQLAEVGVILLMFGVGLQFHIEDLLAVRRVAVPGAIAQCVVATTLGAAIARAFGWDWPAGIVFGMALSVASTVVLVRILADNRDLHTPAGHIAVGWLVVEDLFTVVALVLLPALVGGRGSGSNLGVALGVTALKVAALVAFAIVVGNRAIPRLLDHVAATLPSRSRGIAEGGSGRGVYRGRGSRAGVDRSRAASARRDARADRPRTQPRAQRALRHIKGERRVGRVADCRARSRIHGRSDSQRPGVLERPREA